VALTIAEKINTQQKIKIAGIDELDIMITEMNAAEKIFDAYKAKGMEIL
jgi:DeoR/GlpR family transcriptional regulator of sugar metabolism